MICQQSETKTTSPFLCSNPLCRHLLLCHVSELFTARVPSEWGSNETWLPLPWVPCYTSFGHNAFSSVKMLPPTPNSRATWAIMGTGATEWPPWLDFGSEAPKTARPKAGRSAKTSAWAKQWDMPAGVTKCSKVDSRKKNKAEASLRAYVSILYYLPAQRQYF